MIVTFLKKYWLLIFIFGFVIIFGRDLNPFDSKAFTGHDETQAARVIEFGRELKNGHVPPRISSNMSFGLGYPIFNFYAPTAYWITTLISFIGFSVSQALKLSYLLALVMSLLGMYYFLRGYVKSHSAIIGAILYATSPYVAVDLFVRANLAEVWFLALLPWSLYVIATVSNRRLFLAVIILASVFSVHNIFSLLVVPLLVGFSLLQKKWIAVLSVFLGLLMASSFLIPALGEMSFVHASTIAVKTEYQDHFLCIGQIWYSPWGYGGSTPGCVSDGMSFMLGKLQIMLGALGVLFLYVDVLRKKLTSNKFLFISLSVILIGSLVMTLSISEPVWKALEPVLSLFQFPWRFLLFTIFGLSFFAAYAVNRFPRKYGIILSTLAILAIIISSPKFFRGQMISEERYLAEYASDNYIKNTAAFRVAEYLPTSVTYDYWRLFETDADNPIFLNTRVFPIHDAPYWNIKIDGKKYIPDRLDLLGRPVLPSGVDANVVTVSYSQTPLEHIANAISLLTGIMVLTYSLHAIWQTKKISKKTR